MAKGWVPAALVVAGVALCGVGIAGAAAGWGTEETTTTEQSTSPTSATTTTTSTTSTTSTTQPSPDPQAFLDELAAAFRAGDADALIAVLHPVALERYGEPACRALFASADPTRAFVVVGEPHAEPFDYASDGQSTIVEDAVTAPADVTVDGATERRDVHIAVVDGSFRFFSDCGEPVT